MCENFQTYFRKFVKRGKMDFCAGSQPQLFISFCLDDEFTGQPADASDEAMDTGPTFLNYIEQRSATPSESIEVIEITLSSPDPAEVASEGHLDTTVKTEPEFPATLQFSEVQRRDVFSCRELWGLFIHGSLKSWRRQLSV